MDGVHKVHQAKKGGGERQQMILIYSRQGRYEGIAAGCEMLVHKITPPASPPPPPIPPPPPPPPKRFFPKQSNSKQELRRTEVKSGGGMLLLVFSPFIWSFKRGEPPLMLKSKTDTDGHRGEVS